MEIKRRDQHSQETSNQQQQANTEDRQMTNPGVETLYENSSGKLLPNDSHTTANDDTGIMPDLAHQPSEDDELGEQMALNYRAVDFVEENELEQHDQDYRDGDNQAGEDQDDGDELRDGK